MKLICFIFYVLLVTTWAVQTDSLRENTISVAEDGGNEINGSLSGGRTKRGISGIGSRIITLGAAGLKGLRARQKLLKGLTPVKKLDSVTYYNKNGGVNKMIDDFDEVNPTNVRPYKVDGIPVGRTGKVGDRTILYDTGHKTRVSGLTLWKRNRNGDFVADVIVYHK